MDTFYERYLDYVFSAHRREDFFVEANKVRAFTTQIKACLWAKNRPVSQAIALVPLKCRAIRDNSQCEVRTAVDLAYTRASSKTIFFYFPRIRSSSLYSASRKLTVSKKQWLHPPTQIRICVLT